MFDINHSQIDFVLITDWQNSLRVNSYASLVLAKNFIKEKNGERYYVKILKFAIWKLTNAKCIIFKNPEEDSIKTLRKYSMNAAIKIIINIRAVHYSVAFTLDFVLITDWQNSLRVNSYASLVLAKNFIKEKNGERYYVKILKFAIWKLTNAKCIIFKNPEEDSIKTLRKYSMNAAIKIIINIRAVHYSVAFTLHQRRHYEEVLLV